MVVSQRWEMSKQMFHITKKNRISVLSTIRIRLCHKTTGEGNVSRRQLTIAKNSNLS